MDEQLKKRLIGAVVLIALAVVFLPMILDGSGSDKASLQVEMDIPERPKVEPKLELPDPGLAKPITFFDPEPEAEQEAPPVDLAEPELSEPAPRSEDTVVAVKPELTAWVVQVGSFAAQDSAKDMRDRLRQHGYAAFIRQAESKGKIVYRVKVGPEATRTLAEVLQGKLKKQEKLDGIILAHTG